MLAITTIATVGYGDRYPVTMEGRRGDIRRQSSGIDRYYRELKPLHAQRSFEFRSMYPLSFLESKSSEHALELLPTPGWRYRVIN